MQSAEVARLFELMADLLEADRVVNAGPVEKLVDWTRRPRSAGDRTAAARRSR